MPVYLRDFSLILAFSPGLFSLEVRMSPEIKHWREQVIALSALKLRYRLLCRNEHARSSDIANLLAQMEQRQAKCLLVKTGLRRP